MMRLGPAVLLVAWVAACDAPPADPDADAGIDASAAPDAAYPPVVVLPDEREPCADRDPLRRPFFGDLHVHTALSFDAAAYDVRTRPDDAYRFARGEEIGLPPYDVSGAPTRTLRISRPLDFAAVTDHSEFLAETWICNDPSSPGYDTSTCRTYRMADVRTGYGELTSALVTARRALLCRVHPELCGGVLGMAWQEVQDAAEAHYDRTSACSFTTFVGYEWTGTATGSNLHRNVIFRGRSVPREPTSYFEASTPERLWDALERGCLETGTPCDVLAIPHNGNLSGGTMFVPMREDGRAYDAAFAERRARLEPLLELYQHKGASECVDHIVDPLASEDELCRFEELHPRVCRDGEEPPGCAPSCDVGGGIGFLGGCVAPSDFARGGLRLGLAQDQMIGANPFALGFIGSTDTHQSLAGGADEATFRGHLGDSEDEPEEQLTADGTILLRGLTSSAGGLAVVWAEENSRDAIFDAMRRRETYATSGTRIVVRFFGGAAVPAGLCGASTLVASGYAMGVPMGGDIEATSAPRFVVAAMRDPEGAPLAAIQIVKGWVESDGTTHERVYDVAGDITTGRVDPDSCAVDPERATDELCAEWVDPDFVAGQRAFYYARVLEVPTCRWSRYVCMEQGVDCATITPDDPLASCCPTSRHVIRERAWTSPIWSG